MQQHMPLAIHGTGIVSYMWLVVLMVNLKVMIPYMDTMVWIGSEASFSNILGSYDVQHRMLKAIDIPEASARGSLEAWGLVLVTMQVYIRKTNHCINKMSGAKNGFSSSLSENQGANMTFQAVRTCPTAQPYPIYP